MQPTHLLPLVLALSVAACGAPERGAPRASQAATGRRPLTLDDVSHPTKRLSFDGERLGGLEWLDGERYLEPPRGDEAASARWTAVDARTGERRTFLECAALAAALEKLEDLEPATAARLARRRDLVWNEARDALLLTHEGDLFWWELGAPEVRRLTRTPAPEELASFSPDGARVAFVRENDFFVLELASGAERRLSEGGGENLYHGKLDWLYQEEVYGRGDFKGYWWSPDSARLAYLSLDQTDVPRYTVVDDRPIPPALRVFPYPKAGDPNPKASLSIVDVADGATRALDLAPFAEAEPLLVRVAWAPRGETLSFQVQDRVQSWLELCFADPASGSWRRVLRETTPAWVEVHENPRWLADGSFLWLSERDGYKHLWRYGDDGRELARLTRGEWEVRGLEALDEQRGLAYFSASEANPIGADVYRVRLDGTGLERLTDGRGTHAPSFSPDARLFLDTWSALDSPPQLHLRSADGALVRTLEENALPVLAELALQPLERHQVPTRDGGRMEALLIKPAGFDPARRYPVYQHLYAGPRAPLVRDRWPGRRGMFWQLLAQEGFVVWVCDNRSAGGGGAVAAWPVHGRLVETELSDIEDGVAWLSRLPWIDEERIALNGWSFGGLMVCYALTHSRSFAAGIAGGSVTDWRNYDTIYTERYMGLPRDNEDGYRRTAPRLAAADLHGELLLIHGTMDDNVHPQNTLQFAYELQQAGKLFELMLYPGSEHAVVAPALAHHMNATVLDFLRRKLLAPRP